MGQTVVAVGELCRQRPGVVQGALHGPAGQRQVVVEIGKVKIQIALHADPVVDGTQYKVQLVPALGQDGAGLVRVRDGGAQLQAQTQGEPVPQLRLDGAELRPGGGPVEACDGFPLQAQQVAVVGNAEFPQPGLNGDPGVVHQLRTAVRRNFCVAVSIAEVHNSITLNQRRI